MAIRLRREYAEMDSLSRDWAALYRAQRPAYPVGFDADQMENASSFFRSRVYYPGYDADAGLPEPTVADSLLERGLRRFSGLPDLKQLPPRSYVAIVRAAPDLQMGIESITEEASFHVVQGSW